LRYLRFHDLRHAFNTRLLEAGVQQEIRKALMGHSSGEEVNSIYTHVEIGLKREALEKLERWVASERKAAKEKAEQETENPNDRTTDTGSGDTGGALPER
jgi:hypothetical protein